jgi:hypothetical protein
VTRGPFASLAPEWRRRLFLVSFALVLVVGALLSRLDGPLRTAAAPHGIVSFELARHAETAERILASWDDAARTRAALSLGLDYLFLVAYGTALALACERAGTRMAPALGAALAWGQLGAALLDAVENAALARILLGTAGRHAAVVAWSCAAAKFALVCAGLLFAAAGELYRLRRPRYPESA